MRQLLLLVTNALLGHPEARDGLMTCEDVAKIVEAGTVERASVYRNLFGENLSSRRAEQTDVFRKLNAFGIGGETSNAADNLLVYGADDPKLRPFYEELVASDTSTVRPRRIPRHSRIIWSAITKMLDRGSCRCCARSVSGCFSLFPNETRSNSICGTLRFSDTLDCFCGSLRKSTAGCRSIVPPSANRARPKQAFDRSPHSKSG